MSELFWCFAFPFFMLKNDLFLGSVPMQIDSSVSQAIQNSDKISMTKNLVFSDETVGTTPVAT